MQVICICTLETIVHLHLVVLRSITLFYEVYMKCLLNITSLIGILL